VHGADGNDEIIITPRPLRHSRLARRMQALGFADKMSHVMPESITEKSPFTGDFAFLALKTIAN
jgi:hypothetical protein